jgi:hypothetical protein
MSGFSFGRTFPQISGNLATLLIVVRGFHARFHPLDRSSLESRMG